MDEISGIEAIDLRKRFDKVVALNSINFKIPSGHIVGLLGQNGAGKSTLVRLLSGVMRPTSGTAKVGGFDLHKQLKSVKRITGLLPEEYALYEKLTVYEYIEFLASLYDLSLDNIQANFLKFSNLLEINGLQHRLIETLSKGQKQKVALIAALIHEPLILFLDEPIANLDVKAQRVVRNIIKSYRDESKLIIIASHLLSSIQDLCDYIIIIDKGTIRYEGTLQEFQLGGDSLEDAYVKYLEELE